MVRKAGAFLVGAMLAMIAGTAIGASDDETCTIVRHRADGTTETYRGSQDDAARASDGRASARAQGRRSSSSSVSASSSSDGNGRHGMSSSSSSSDGRTVTTTHDERGCTVTIDERGSGGE